ncbi:MAG TPA: glycoside hydrolase family 3 N-terminal domain-containing protein, partial [Capsulimonadaceae bacterium]|nr:glycoside hydrolase family 3 N-terminal domain-containing protein [Capsulimonadaceae bacterium]
MKVLRTERPRKPLALMIATSLVLAGAAPLVGPVTALAQGDGATPPVVATNSQAYRDTSLPLETRVDSLIGQMTLGEKVAQLQNAAPAIPRLGVPAYNYWSEGLHGIANEGIATVFPQAIGNAATWDPALVHAIGDVVSTEARAKFNAKGIDSDHGWFNGLTVWSPNINIFRDPRWGRGQETYGEDPFLTAQMGVAFIQGMQGDDPNYLKAVACAKHFAVHSGPEPLRHQFDARPPERDLYETYLPQFEAAVREGHVGQVMSAYSAIDGIPAPADSWLLTDLLRQQWGFQGYVVSDCDAIGDIVSGHHYAATMEEAAADAVKAGTDLNCGRTYRALVEAVHNGLISEDQINTALRRVLTMRFRLGLFDPPTYAYAKITAADNDTPEHSALALQAAHESMVLLKNNGILPLDTAKIKRVAVIGSNADSTSMLQGNYNGTPSHPVSILQGLKDALGPGVEVAYAKGCPLAVTATDSFGPSSPDYQQALDAAKNADVVIYVGGISARLEGEQMRVNAVGFAGGDRTRIELPQVQEDLLKSLRAVGKPIVFI